MTKRELADAIEDLRSELAEARRYVRRRPKDADDGIARFLGKLTHVRHDESRVDCIAYRIACNLEAGQRCRVAAPQVLEGYIEGALWELAWIKGEVEAEAKACG